MSGSYELLLERSVAESLRQLRGARRKVIFEFLELLARDPFIEGGITFEDLRGRLLQKVSIGGVIIAFHADHAVREVKILTLEVV